MHVKPIYLDYQSTTPVDERVVSEMLPFFKDNFANPASSTHVYGEMASKKLEESRKDLADLLNCKKSEIVFTSGATESNNMALLGISKFLRKSGKTHIISSEIEHKAVLEPLKKLEQDGFEIEFLPPNQDGTFNFDLLKKSIKSNTGLVSIMHANNEIGLINPIKEISNFCKEKNILFHTDMAQTLGKLSIDFQDLNVDLASFSSHKIYGPKGIGAIFIRKGTPFEPLILGGGHENGFRAGTPALMLIVGFVKAVQIAYENIIEDTNHIKNLRDLFLEKLESKFPGILVNGPLENRLVNNLNISFLDFNSETLIMNLWGKVAAANGSACSSLSWDYSHVLKAMKLPKKRIESALRFSFGRFSTEEEVLEAVESIIAIKNKLAGVL